MEIEIVKSTKHTYGAKERGKSAHVLDDVKISVEKKNGELVVTTDMPCVRGFLMPFLHGARDIDMAYSVKLPSSLHIIVDHQEGEIRVDGMTGNIQAVIRKGTINLRLPSTAEYSVDAVTKIGSVISDYPGITTRHSKFGQWFVHSSQASRKLILINCSGDICIHKMEPSKLEPLPMIDPVGIAVEPECEHASAISLRG